MSGKNDNKPTGEQQSVPQRKFLGDPGDEEGANEYGYQDIMASRAGHNFVFSDVDGKEFVRLQHRSGSGFIFNPDGSAKMTIFNGIYNDIRGEMVVNTSGDLDFRSEKNGSLRTEGSFDVTAEKANFTSHDSISFASGSNMNMMVGGKTHLTTKGFQIYSASDGPITLQSTGAGVELSGGNATVLARDPSSGLASVGGAQVGISAEKTDVAVTAQAGVSISTIGGDIHINASGGGGKVYINSSQPFKKANELVAANLPGSGQVGKISNPLTS